MIPCEFHTGIETEDLREFRNRVIGPTVKTMGQLDICGEEMVEKIVKLSGNGGRVYLPAGLGGMPCENRTTGLICYAAMLFQ